MCHGQNVGSMDIHGVWTSIPQLESFSTTQGLANSPKENLTMATFENAMPGKIAVKKRKRFSGFCRCDPYPDTWPISGFLRISLQ